ncbi:MAG TPA: Crp/Fnr family transcriptional regulator [Dyella sp.]|uniref:Crp/Fnr family transcriptional regulator n=1 Tax=Dyella sp. TaxID=1869338 RepID=UPI002F955070
MAIKEYVVEDDHSGSTLERRLAILRRSSLFGEMPEALMHHIATHAAERRLRGGDVLFLKNDPQDFIAIVVSGCVYTMVYGPDGRELIVNTSAAGDVIGEAALIDERQRDTTAFVCAPTQVLILRRHHFAVLTAEPEFLHRLLSLLCTRLREVGALVESVCLHRLESRLARYFVSAADECGRKQAGGVVVPMPPSQSVLAAMINASRPKLNAQLQAWRRSGLVSWTQHSMLITDVEQMRSMAYAVA